MALHYVRKKLFTLHTTWSFSWVIESGIPCFAKYVIFHVAPITNQKQDYGFMADSWIKTSSQCTAAAKRAKPLLAGIKVAGFVMLLWYTHICSTPYNSVTVSQKEHHSDVEKSNTRNLGFQSLFLWGKSHCFGFLVTWEMVGYMIQV